MKLNHDCIRAVLLDIEDNVTLSKRITINQFLKFKHSSKFTIQDITYSLVKLEEVGYIDAAFKKLLEDGTYYYSKIGNLTYIGHEFLDNIRDPEIWKKTKEAASKVGKFSITTLASYAVEIGRQVLGI